MSAQFSINHEGQSGKIQFSKGPNIFRKRKQDSVWVERSPKYFSNSVSITVKQFQGDSAEKLVMMSNVILKSGSKPSLEGR